MTDNNIHNIKFEVNIDSEKGVVTYLSSEFNGEKEVLIKDGKRETVSKAAEAIRMKIMEHKSNRYSRY